MQRGALLLNKSTGDKVPQKVFTSEALRRVYLQLLKEHAGTHGLRILAYCLMNTHVHVVAIPEKETSLALTFRAAHTRFAQFWNADLGGAGKLWQNRFYSSPIDNANTPELIAYIENNPVRAGFARHASEYAWSSARAHLELDGKEELMDRGLHLDLLDMNWWRTKFNAEQWAAKLADAEYEDWSAVRAATFGGRPIGSPEFVAGLEAHFGRRLTPGKSGRPRKKVRSEEQPQLQKVAAV